MCISFNIPSKSFPVQFYVNVSCIDECTHNECSIKHNQCKMLLMKLIIASTNMLFWSVIFRLCIVFISYAMSLCGYIDHLEI